MRTAPGLIAEAEIAADSFLDALTCSEVTLAYTAVAETAEKPYSWAIISSRALISTGGAGSVSDNVNCIDVRALSTVAETTRAPVKSDANLSLFLQKGNISYSSTESCPLNLYKASLSKTGCAHKSIEHKAMN